MVTWMVLKTMKKRYIFFRIKQTKEKQIYEQNKQKKVNLRMAIKGNI